MRIITTLCAGWLLTACSGATGGAPEASVASAREQSPTGAQVYTRECAGCHGKHGEGLNATPAVMGAGSLTNWQSAAELHEYVKTNMPLPKSRVGSLSQAEYWAVVGFMLAANGVEVPEAGLSPENAASVKLR